VITDLRMREVDGLAVLRAAKEHSPETVVVVITAFASTETAVEAMKLGAYDYITKPFKMDEIKLVLANALERKRLQDENQALKRQLRQERRFENFVGGSRQMLEIFETIRKTADSLSTVLVTGESGTGKELVARAIHEESPRRNGPFVSVNCGAIPETLMESELFGHVKGAFTGAVASTPGLFSAANAAPSSSMRSPRSPVAAGEAAARDPGAGDPSRRRHEGRQGGRTLDRGVESRRREGRAGGDPSGGSVLPPQRHPDPHPAAARAARGHPAAPGPLHQESVGGARPVRASRDAAALAVLESYRWPGNIRELQNVIERALVLGSGEVLDVDALPPDLRRPRTSSTSRSRFRRAGSTSRRHSTRSSSAISSSRSREPPVCRRARPSCSA